MRYVGVLLSTVLTRTFLFILFVIPMILPMTAHGEEIASCGRAVPVALAGSFHGYGSASAGDFFAVDVQPGILMVEAVVPADARVEPKLALFDQHCRLTEHAGRGFTVRERRVDGMVVKVTEPATLRFAVAPQDRRRGLGPYELVTRFIDAPGRGADPQPNTGVEEPEPDPDPDGLLCGADTGDQGDVLFCATSLEPGTSTKGDVANGGVFSFVLSGQRTVLVEIRGNAETIGALYDPYGQRLAVADGDGERAGVRIVRTLGPGRYFVRVEGAGGAEGAYTLRIAELGW